MGDIYPYGHPHSYTRAQVYGWIASLTRLHPDPDVFTAIAEAESSLDPNVINDTPATGDYSVGLWQVNYFGFLYAERAALYGSPGQLVASGLELQSYAAVDVWYRQGLSAWTTYTSGAYRRYLAGPPPPGATVAPGQKTAPVDTRINPPTEDYSATVHTVGDQIEYSARALTAAAIALESVRDGNPHG